MKRKEVMVACKGKLVKGEWKKVKNGLRRLFCFVHPHFPVFVLKLELMRRIVINQLSLRSPYSNNLVNFQYVSINVASQSREENTVTSQVLKYFYCFFPIS